VSGAAQDLVGRTVDLCRALRARGLPVTSVHAADAVRALDCVGLQSRAGVYYGLRCVLAARPEEFAVFDELFDEYFGAPSQGERAQPRRARVREEVDPKLKPMSLSSWMRQAAPDEPDDEPPEELRAANDRFVLTHKDFATFGDDELDEIERIAAQLARRLAARPSRRWRAARRGPRVDLRRSVRKSLGSAAELTDLCRRRRKPRKTRIVALCDVSGSMDLYSRLLLQFLYALQGSVARVESFVFATELCRATEALRERPYASALRGLSARVRDWSGGTRIGACLAAFNKDHANLLDRRTVVVVLSDGWDTGEPEQLGDALEAIAARSRRVLWLNPLLDSPGYEPLTRGMQAALPHISVLAACHNLASLRALQKHLLA
jgi:uncharacterized protein with von Willebrand factor type A (vWA) domain